MNYLLPYPDLVRGLADASAVGRRPVGLHKLPQFLAGLSTMVSRYYSRVRILREPLPHTVAKTLARLLLLKVQEFNIDKLLAVAVYFLKIIPIF